ncbi:MAG: 4Fe-4S binding protein [Deltaproteobacteria bacterium]|jgi:Pyruvate/2-oxoacid:ferredoxin oxidoreductase delta subunit|nr:4Fe-4S binding protein [Deltaproteobacteria bacterium]
MVEDRLREKYVAAAEVVCKQGMVQFPVSETAVAIIKNVVGPVEEELDFICAFSEKPSQGVEQLTASSGLPAEKVDALAASLARKGLIFNQPSSSGVMVYRLLPLMLVGVMEYKFMVPLEGTDEERELAELFETLLSDLRDDIQNNYDTIMPLFRASPATDRTVPSSVGEDGGTIRTIPVDQPVETGDEFIVPSQTVREIIEKFDDIAVGHCFCRQRRGLLGDACATKAPTLNCFTFGKSARHTAAQGFAKMVSREEAFDIMLEAEKAGLVHKAFHPGSRENAPETSICNCCKDCCDTFNLWRNGTMPMINSTYHLAVVDDSACSGCETCVGWCPVDAIALNDDGVAVSDENTCIGCGVCARFCPEEAISLKEGLRKVFALPPRMR